MNTKYLKLVVLALTFVAFSAHAEKKRDIMRGGTGFLFADANAFQNAGQLTMNSGFALQVAGSTSSLNGTSTLGATPSFAWSNMSVAFGGYYSRSGADLMEDFVGGYGAALGFSLKKGAITVGFTYENTMDNPAGDEATGGAVVNFNFGGKSKGGGTTFGVRATTVISDMSPVITAGFGHMMSKNNGFEANITFNSTSDFSDWVGSGHLLLGGKTAYLGAGYVHHALDAYGELKGRVGLVFGNADLCGFVTYPLVDTQTQTFGGSFRLVF